MKQMYAKITFRIFLLSFLALLFMGCGQQGSPGGGSGPGATAAIQLASSKTTAPADGVSSVPISATLTDSVGAAVNQYTSVTFTTNMGTFQNGKQQLEVMTPDTSGAVGSSAGSNPALDPREPVSPARPPRRSGTESKSPLVGDSDKVRRT